MGWSVHSFIVSVDGCLTYWPVHLDLEAGPDHCKQGGSELNCTIRLGDQVLLLDTKGTGDRF